MKKTKVTLLGDSIRLIGYGTKVPELLGEEFEVYQPEENCRYSAFTYRGLFDWAEGIKGSDVIHWNNGLWDACTLFSEDESFTPLAFYLDTMERIAKELLKITPKVIFATTTPVADGHRYNKNPLIDKYNEAVVPRLTALGVEINDLHSLVFKHRDEYLKDDKVHLNEKGIDATAKQVVESIKKILN